MYGRQGKKNDGRIAVDVMLGHWGDPIVQALVQNLFGSSVFDGSVFVTDMAMPIALSMNPATQSIIQLGAGALSPVDAEGCLCCGIRSGLGDALSQLFLDALSKRRPVPSRVLILGDGEDAQAITQTVRHAPFLAQRYVMRHVWQIGTSGP